MWADSVDSMEGHAWGAHLRTAVQKALIAALRSIIVEYLMGVFPVLELAKRWCMNEKELKL